MFYVITYENGAVRFLENSTYNEVLKYAESHNGGWEYTIEEYDSSEAYFSNV